jgi:hypothetical protein
MDHEGLAIVIVLERCHSARDALEGHVAGIDRDRGPRRCAGKSSNIQGGRSNHSLPSPVEANGRRLVPQIVGPRSLRMGYSRWRRTPDDEWPSPERRNYVGGVAGVHLKRRKNQRRSRSWNLRHGSRRIRRRPRARDSDHRSECARKKAACHFAMRRDDSIRNIWAAPRGGLIICYLTS